MSSSRQQLQHQQLQMVQNQQQSQSSSISSCASVQTVLLHATTTTTMQTSTTTTISKNSLLQPNAMISSTYSGTSGHEMLNIADVADLLHPQHAIITGEWKIFVVVFIMPSNMQRILFVSGRNFCMFLGFDIYKSLKICNFFEDFFYF